MIDDKKIDELRKTARYPLSELLQEGGEEPRWQHSHHHACAICAFWRPLHLEERKGDGECRFDPPNVNVDEGQIKAFPEGQWLTTDARDWCGRFQVHPDARKAWEQLKAHFPNEPELETAPWDE